MSAIGRPPYRRGSKKTTDIKVGILNGNPALQVNWGGRIYGAQLYLTGAGNIKEDLDVKDIRATGNITFSKNSSVYNNSNRVIMSGGITKAGDGNMAIGNDTNLSSLIGATNNIENIAIGTNTLQQVVNGKYNVAIGIGAMYNIGKNSSETYDDVEGNVAIGGGALKGRGTRPQGSYNVAIGHGSMLNIDTHDGGYGLTAKQNVCLGFASGQNLEGENNIYLGYTAGLGTPFYQVGNDNVGIGAASLYSVKDADDNICIGSASGRLIEDGDRNICIGTNAGNAIVDGNNNICIGYDTDVNAEDALSRVLISPIAATVDANYTTLIANNIVINDVGTSNTTAGTYYGTKVDFDKTGTSTSDNTIYGLNVQAQNTTATNGTNTMYGINCVSLLTHDADAGTSTSVGGKFIGRGASNGTSTAIGLEAWAFGADTNIQLRTTYDASNYADFTVASDGHLEIATVGTDADFTLDVAGDVTINADGGHVALADGLSTYTPTNTNDATTKTYVDTKYFFSQTMSFYSRSSDHDLEWIICNTSSFYKLGGAHEDVDDTETAIISSVNQTILRSLWFIVPYNMTITHISGNVMDDDLDSHATGNYRLGIWVVASLGTSGSTPAAQTGSKTFTLKYVTPTVSGTESSAYTYAFYDASPSLTLSAGDGVWVGNLNTRSSASDDTTINMSIWGYAT